MMTKAEQIEYLRKNYNHSFPINAKFKRSDNRIYFAGDFEDNEAITFDTMCSKPSSCGYGNAWYKGVNGVSKLINVAEVSNETL
jgi:hypothetical protein